MRHRKKNNHLSRKVGHRKALLRNLSIALVTHKRITTTVAKAKALRRFVEPLLTRSKTNTTHSRRTVFKYLQNKEAVKEIFDNISSAIAERPGGYVRIIRTGFRPNDGAEMCIIELVDYNKTAMEAPTKRRRTRRGRRKKTANQEVTTETTETQEQDAAPEAESQEEDKSTEE